MIQKMKKNEIYNIKIEDMGNDGEGIGHIVEMSGDMVKAGTESGTGDMQKNTGRDLGQTGREIGQTGREIGQTGREIGQTGREIGQTGREIGQTGREMRQTGKATRQIGMEPELSTGEESRRGNRGVTVFVKDTVVGDIARIRIVKVKKQYAYGRLEEIISPSPYRVAASCVNARSCGGCTLMHMSYEKQLECKWNKVRNCLERIGGLEHAADRMEPICGMKQPYHYRNKMQFPVGLDRNGRVQIGFYAGRTHSIIDLEDCAIGHPIHHDILRELRLWLQEWQDRTGTFIYDEKQHKGLVRHILTRVGFATGELMVCVVINGEKLYPVSSGNRAGKHSADVEKDCIAELQEHLLQAVGTYNQRGKEDIGHTLGNSYNGRKNEDGQEEETGQIEKAGQTEAAGRIILKSLTLNINQEQTNRILGDTCRTLWGEPFITDYIGNICFHISPMSFYQVNPVQTKLLYEKALEYADLSGEEIVWDMYCGIGTISLCLAQKAKKVYGVEIVPQAIEDARENAALNGINNTEFFCGKAEEVVPEFYRKGENAGRHPDVVVVDPPRKGCEEVLLRTIVEMAPKWLVYVSCDPATLARDVKRLGEMGYEVRKIAVYDQFGHSGHVETVALMSKAK